MFIIRWILGRIILLLNFVFSPKKLKRETDAQATVDAQTQSLQLYQYEACPFCVKVRRDMRRKNLNIKTVNAKKAENKQLLETQGGKFRSLVYVLKRAITLAGCMNHLLSVVT